MADQFKLEADELGRVANGLRDVESRLTAAVSRLRGQLGAGGTPWQFSGGPAGVEANLENACGRSVELVAQFGVTSVECAAALVIWVRLVLR